MKLFNLLCCAMLAVATAYSVNPPDSRPSSEVQSLEPGAMTELGSIMEEEQPTPSVEPPSDMDQVQEMLDDAMLQSDETAQISLSYSTILRYYKIRSIFWSTRLHATFYNRSPEDLLLYWVNYHGYCVCIATIRRYGGVSVNTYGSHPLMATTKSGQVRGIYIMYGRNAAVVFH